VSFLDFMHVSVENLLQNVEASLIQNGMLAVSGR